MNNFYPSPLPEGQRPQILFRVEHSNNSSFRNHNMVARDCGIPLTWKACDNHLSWNRNANTPFLSFFDSWGQALKRRRLRSRGEQDVVIIAVWAKDMHHLYDAEHIARSLGYNNSGQDHRRKLAYFQHEYLVWGGIAADDYRILGVFSGDGPERSVLLRSLTNTTHTFQASLPGDFGDNATRRDVSIEVLIEMYSCTGVIDAYKYNVLIACMGRAGTVMSAER
jgi:hypothetical protein